MSKKHSPRFLEIVDSAKRRIQELNPDELHERLEENPNLYLVDVREESEYNDSHVSNAIHLSKGVLERDIETTIEDPAAEIVLYCGGGYRSALAADNLQKMGYRNVYSLDGGFRALKDHPEFSIE